MVSQSISPSVTQDAIKAAKAQIKKASKTVDAAKRLLVAEIMAAVEIHFFTPSQFEFAIARLKERPCRQRVYNSSRSRHTDYDGTSRTKILPSGQIYEGITGDGQLIEKVWVGLLTIDLMDLDLMDLIALKKDVLNAKLWPVPEWYKAFLALKTRPSWFNHVSYQIELVEDSAEHESDPAERYTMEEATAEIRDVCRSWFFDMGLKFDIVDWNRLAKYVAIVTA